MKITKQYCDLCKKEIMFENTVSLSPRLDTHTLKSGWSLFRDAPCMDHPFGRNTVDNVWEMELCDDCFRKALKLIEGMKE